MTQPESETDPAVRTDETRGRWWDWEERTVFRLRPERMKDEKGFTLVELLVVIVIIAVLAAIAIPVFLGQRQKAQDAAAKSIVRNAMTAIESSFIDASTFDPTAEGMLPADLHAMETSITFVVLADATTAPTATVGTDTVNYTGTATTYAVGVRSESGTSFGIIVDKDAGNTHYVGGVARDW